MRLLPEDAVLYTQTRIITGIKIYVLRCDNKECGASFYPHPWKQGNLRSNVVPDFAVTGIYFYSSKRLYTLPLLWYFRAEMVHGLAPEAAIKTWASQPQFGLTRSQQMDRFHFHAFVSHLVQVSPVRCGTCLIVPHRLTSFTNFSRNMELPSWPPCGSRFSAFCVDSGRCSFTLMATRSQQHR